MMESLRNASRNTMFERWLESAMTQPRARGRAPEAAQAASEGGSGAGPASGREAAVSVPEAEEKLRAQEEQQELASFLPSREEPNSKDATTFRPGWEVRAPCRLMQVCDMLCSARNRGTSLAACRPANDGEEAETCWTRLLQRATGLTGD